MNLTNNITSTSGSRDISMPIVYYFLQTALHQSK